MAKSGTKKNTVTRCGPGVVVVGILSTTKDRMVTEEQKWIPSQSWENPAPVLSRMQLLGSFTDAADLPESGAVGD